MMFALSLSLVIAYVSEGAYYTSQLGLFIRKWGYHGLGLKQSGKLTESFGYRTKPIISYNDYDILIII